MPEITLRLPSIATGICQVIRRRASSTRPPRPQAMAVCCQASRLAAGSRLGSAAELAAGKLALVAEGVQRCGAGQGIRRGDHAEGLPEAVGEAEREAIGGRPA